MPTVTYPFAHGSSYTLKVSGLEASRAVFTGKATDLAGGTTDMSVAAYAVADELSGGARKSHYPRTGEQAVAGLNDLPLDNVTIQNKYRCGAATFSATYGRSASHDPIGNANDNAVVTAGVESLRFEPFLSNGAVINAPPWPNVQDTYLFNFPLGAAVATQAVVFIPVETIMISTVLDYDPRGKYANTNAGQNDLNGNPIVWVEPYIGRTNSNTICIARADRGPNEVWLKGVNVNPVWVYDFQTKLPKQRFAVQYELVWWDQPGHQDPDFYFFLNSPGSGWHDRYIRENWTLPTHSGLIQA